LFERVAHQHRRDREQAEGRKSIHHVECDTGVEAVFGRKWDQMTAGRIVALIFAILLLLPAGLILALLADSPVPATREDYQVILPILAAILSPAALLFWVAFRPRR
jgi:hypothetical protein